MSGSALFSDRVGISAGPSLHDLLRSLEDGKIVQFTVSGRVCDFRIVGLEIGNGDPINREEGAAVTEWMIKAVFVSGGSGEKIYQGLYNSHARSGMFERPKTFG